MPSTELDLPVLVTPEQIRRREFVQTRRGYDSTQVREYLEQIARQVEQMQALLRDARMEADAVTRASSLPKADAYEQLAGRVAELLRTADRQAEQMKADARAEAKTILREARTDADRIRLDAQSGAKDARDRAERALREARERADATISGLASRRAALVDQLANMQERLLSVARELSDAIDGPADALVVPATDAEPATSVGAIADDVPQTTDEAADVRAATDHADDGAPSDEEDDGTVDEVIDVGAHELWASEDVELQIPEIPPLDLEWDAPED